MASSSRTKEFDPVPEPIPISSVQAFDKGAVVFNCIRICGTRRVSNASIRHAANVAAQWLDNDGDGEVDEPEVAVRLGENNATVVMTYNQDPSRKLRSGLRKEDCVFQSLYEVETNKRGRRDASQEEIHHLLQEAGWSEVYPDTFGTSDGTVLAKVWAKAEEMKYYRYDDPTCGKRCRMVEFLYKGMAAYHGATSDLADNEIKLWSRAELREKLPEFVDMIEDEKYRYQRWMWPDGKYRHDGKIEYYGTARVE